MSKVLEFGNQEEALCRAYYPDDEITIKPLVGEWWLDFGGPYKGIFAFYVLNKTPYPLEQRILDNWANSLEPGGIVHIIVPSLHYLCRMMQQSPQPNWIKPMLLDATNHFTMHMLRILIGRTGKLDVIKAKTGPAELEFHGDNIEIEQHYVAAVRREDS
jgi:hypothetical protein